MLDDWDNYVKQFVKVVPIEYKKVMEAEKAEKAALAEVAK